MSYNYENIDEAMRSVFCDILENGTESSPRGKRVKELIGRSVSFDMRYPLCVRPSRRLGYRFAPAEAAWILSGDNRLDRIKKYSPFIWEFSDDGFFYSGAYGPRIVDQLTYVCDVLSDDPDTRQAVIEVWRPNPRPGRDIPCTLSFQFIAREGKLHCIQSMRSSDAWLGYPYDAFNAAMLTGYILIMLRERKNRGRVGLNVGNHTLVVGSQHLYEKEWNLASTFIDDDAQVFEQPEFNPHVFGRPQDLIDHLWNLAAEAFDEPDEMGESHYLTHELRSMKR